MSDLDYGALKTFPGNYDDFMIAATAIQEKMQSDNAKKEAKMKELKNPTYAYTRHLRNVYHAK
jgi:ATPase subunit of ABC transporter with duplicated ATPase domains